MALDGMGLKDFRLFLLAQDNLDQDDSEGGGLEINIPFSLGTIWAILVGDMLTDMEYLTRPYEVNPGQTDKVLQESVDYLFDVFQNRPLQSTKSALWPGTSWATTSPRLCAKSTKCGRRLKSITPAVKAKVKITGEFWLQTHEGDGNYNIKRWLE